LVLVTEFLEEEGFAFQKVLFGGDFVVVVLLGVEGEELAVDVGYTVVEVEFVGGDLEATLESVELGQFLVALEVGALDEGFAGGGALLLIEMGGIDEGGI